MQKTLLLNRKVLKDNASFYRLIITKHKRNRKITQHFPTLVYLGLNNRELPITYHQVLSKKQFFYNVSEVKLNLRFLVPNLLSKQIVGHYNLIRPNNLIHGNQVGLDYFTTIRQNSKQLMAPIPKQLNKFAFLKASVPPLGNGQFPRGNLLDQIESLSQKKELISVSTLISKKINPVGLKQSSKPFINFYKQPLSCSLNLSNLSFFHTLLVGHAHLIKKVLNKSQPDLIAKQLGTGYFPGGNTLGQIESLPQKKELISVSSLISKKINPVGLKENSKPFINFSDQPLPLSLNLSNFRFFHTSLISYAHLIKKALDKSRPDLTAYPPPNFTPVNLYYVKKDLASSASDKMESSPQAIKKVKAQDWSTDTKVPVVSDRPTTLEQAVDLNRLAEKVCRVIERKMNIERVRRGL